MDANQTVESFHKLREVFSAAVQQNNINILNESNNYHKVFEILKSIPPNIIKLPMQFQPVVLVFYNDGRKIQYEKICNKLNIQMKHKNVNGKSLLVSEWLIANNKSKSHLYTILEERRRLETYFFSRDLFFLFLFSGENIFEYPEFIKKYSEKDELLTEIRRKYGFIWWVNDENHDRSTGGFTGPLDPCSVFQEHNYTVGKYSELREDVRRDNLHRIFWMPLGQLSKGGKLNVENWGEGGSKQRLQKIKRNIEYQIRIKKNNVHGDYGTAINDWKGDLLWLEKNAYKPNPFFQKP